MFYFKGRFLPVSSLYRSEKDGGNIGIIVENKLINGLEMNLEDVIITFNHRFSVFKVRAATNVKHLKPMIESYIAIKQHSISKLKKY